MMMIEQAKLEDKVALREQGVIDLTEDEKNPNGGFDSDEEVNNLPSYMTFPELYLWNYCTVCLSHTDISGCEVVPFMSCRKQRINSRICKAFPEVRVLYGLPECVSN